MLVKQIMSCLLFMSASKQRVSYVGIMSSLLIMGFRGSSSMIISPRIEGRMVIKGFVGILGSVSFAGFVVIMPKIVHINDATTFDI